MLAPQEFFDLKDCEHQEIFFEDEAVWTTLDRLKDYLAAFFQKSWPLASFTGHIDRKSVV